MKILLLPFATVLGLLAGCDSVPANRAVTTTNTSNSEQNRARYDNFVTQRTQELQMMGGAFAKNGAARLKAVEEANARFGTPTTHDIWTWGKKNNQTKQAALNDQLNKMAREKNRD